MSDNSGAIFEQGKQSIKNHNNTAEAAEITS